MTRVARLTPPLVGPWVAGLVGGALAGAGAYMLAGREEPGSVVEILTRWPAPLLHGVAAALLVVALLELLGLLTRRPGVPGETEARRDWAQEVLTYCGEQFGRRAVADDQTGAVGQLAGLARSRLADRWSLYAMAATLLGFGWLLLFLSRDVGGLPATRDGVWLLIAGLAESAAALAGAALLWLLWLPRLRAWEADARHALVTAAEQAAPPAKPAVAEEEPAPAPPVAAPAARARLPREGGR